MFMLLAPSLSTNSARITALLVQCFTARSCIMLLSWVSCSSCSIISNQRCSCLLSDQISSFVTEIHACNNISKLYPALSPRFMSKRHAGCLCLRIKIVSHRTPSKTSQDSCSRCPVQFRSDLLRGCLFAVRAIKYSTFWTVE